MGTTAGGLPYPEPTDPIANGAAAIRALAEAADYVGGRVRIATGSGSIPITATGTATSTNIAFPAGRFTAAPVVMVTATGTTPMSLRGPMATSITASGCQVWGGRDSGTASVNFQWLAIQLL